MIKNLIQVAGIIDFREAKLLTDAGVDWLGFPFRLPVHQEDLSETAAAEIIASLHSAHLGVLITYLKDAKEITTLAEKLAVNIVQLHGKMILPEIFKLKKLSDHLFLIKSLIVKKNNYGDLENELQQFSPLVDAFITDTHDPQTGADGATGKIHDWTISRRLVDMSTKPLILAGGLTSENVREAICIVRPAGVDTHTGVEGLDGRKNRQKVAKFVAEARMGFSMIDL